MYKEFINGHGSCYGLWKYLLYDKETGKKRSIYSKLYNLSGDEIDDNGDLVKVPWYKEMDEERTRWDTDTSNNGKKPITFKHYILSPSPEDNITPEELSDFIDEWLLKAFKTEEAGGKFEVAVEMHDDNGILHAHVVFNNPNIEREGNEGLRISSWIKDKKMLYQINDLVNVLAKKRGWHNFMEKDAQDIERAKQGLFDEQREIKEISQETIDLQEKQIQFFEENNGLSPFKKYIRPIDEATNGKIKVTRKGAYIDTKEAEIIRRFGTSNKEDIRKCIDMAIDLSSNMQDFMRVMNCLNVPFKTNNRGDFVYTHPLDTKRQFTGYKLGFLYTKKSVKSRIDKNEKISIESIKKRKYYTGKLAGIGVLAVYHHDSALPIAELAQVVEINNKYNIWNDDDYITKLRSLPEDAVEEREELEWAMEKNEKIYDAKPPRTHLERIEKEMAKEFIHELNDEEFNKKVDELWHELGYDRAGKKKKRAGKSNTGHSEQKKRTSEQQTSQKEQKRTISR